jgi:hypothetical protein
MESAPWLPIGVAMDFNLSPILIVCELPRLVIWRACIAALGCSENGIQAN